MFMFKINYLLSVVSGLSWHSPGFRSAISLRVRSHAPSMACIVHTVYPQFVRYIGHLLMYCSPEFLVLPPVSQMEKIIVARNRIARNHRYVK